MTLIMREWNRGFSAETLAEIADLWNRNAAGRHAFYPWTGELLERQLARNGRGLGRIIEARNGEALIGCCHATAMNEEGYPRAGAVELLLVDSAWRGQGIGSALLRGCLVLLDNQRPRPEFVDALGAWPFGYAYNALADGSERSGVFLREKGLYRLFRKAGFEPVRKSLVMRAKLTGVRPHPPRGDAVVARRRGRTWLDTVFRGRELWDHALFDEQGELLSRAIFGFMEGESRREGKAIFSLFGVNTPVDRRNKGYASANLSRLMRHVGGLGGEELELHVYADNLPALALYRRLGFVELAETMMMHRRL